MFCGGDGGGGDIARMGLNGAGRQGSEDVAHGLGGGIGPDDAASGAVAEGSAVRHLNRLQ